MGREVLSFIGKFYVNDLTELTGASSDRINDGNSFLLHLSHLPSEKFTFFVKYVYTFQTYGDIIKGYSSHMVKNCGSHPVAYGKKNIYYMIWNQFTPYDCRESYNINRRFCQKDEYYDRYEFLYFSRDDGDRKRICSLNLVAPRFFDDAIEIFFRHPREGGGKC